MNRSPEARVCLGGANIRGNQVRDVFPRRLAVILAVILVAVSSAVLITADHRGFNPAEREVGAGNVKNLSLSWIGNGSRVGADLVAKSSPTVIDGVVYFGTLGGQLLAFADSCADPVCNPLWRVDLTEAILNTPAVVDGILYVGTASRLGRLYAFDVAACRSGACDPLWTAHVAVGESSPTVLAGVVYVGSQFGDVYAFDAHGCGQPTCQPIWVGPTGGYVINSPAVAGGTVFAGSSDGRLYAFDAGGCASSTCPPLCSSSPRTRW